MTERRRAVWRAAAVAALILFAVVALGLRRAGSITDDWHGWRQADTQAIARNFAEGGIDLLHPRIDWGGEGPGYVEAELQLYPALVAVAMRAGGEGEVSGQVLSLLCVVCAGAVVFAGTARRLGELPAFCALATLLGSRGVLVMSTSIQPDGLALLAFVLGFFGFLRFLEDARWRWWAAWVVPTALAGLVKPTTLELGLVQVTLVLLAHRGRLRSARLWLGWAVVLGVVAGYLLHAHGLYATYGNTFGILAGGDSKLPSLARLVEPGRWIDLARYTVTWGVGIGGVVAGAYLAFRRRWGPEAWALSAGAAALLVLAFRYTSGPFGTHYHLPHVLLGAWLVAGAAADLLARRRAGGLLVGLAVLLAVGQTARGLRELWALPPAAETALGRALARHAPAGTLVAVRSSAPTFEPAWGTANNYQDPRVFYLSRTRGWAIGSDEVGSERLAEVARRGARFYVHLARQEPDPALAAWLGERAGLVEARPEGSIYRLTPP